MKEAALRPFPWNELLRVQRPSRHAARLERILSHPVTRALVERLRTMTGAEVELRSRRTFDVAKPPTDEGGLALPAAVAVVLVDDDGLPTVFLEVESGLAALLVARAFKRPVHTMRLDPLAKPSAEICGAFAAVAVHALRRSLSGVPLPLLVAGAGPARDILSGEALAGTTMVSFTVRMDGEDYLARVAFSREAAIPLASEGRAAAGSVALERLGDVTIAVPVVACAGLLTVADVTDLTPGAAWIPRDFPLRRCAGGLTGPVVLAAPRAERGVRATLGEDGRLVLGGSVEDLSMGQDERALIENVGDIPVVVRIELGTTEMRAREWAELRPGDVIGIGRPLGSPVTLRVSGVEIAQGELVDLEGEIGVRILEPADATRVPSEAP